MDNLCHTLAGAALGRAGLKNRTALGMATLMIGANLPDIDVVAVPLGHALSFRRGWTHGVLALVVLPLLLTLAVLAWDRWVRRPRSREGAVVPGQILLLSYLSVWSHPALDHLNTYGVRWLMPFSGRWFYGDALFIVDVWMWMMLAAAVLLGPRRRWMARAAVGAAAAYALLMIGTAAVGRRMVRAELARTGSPEARSVMVGPMWLNSFQREVVIDLGDRYRFGTLRWRPRPEVRLGEREVPRNATDPRAVAAAATPAGREFLTWSRYPFFVVGGDENEVRVRLDDARYGAGEVPSWAAVTVTMPRP